MRVLSWILSLLFHASVAFVLIQAATLAPVRPPELMQVDLTVEEKLPELEPCPHPVPVPVKPEKPVPAEAARPAPLPMDKTVMLDDQVAPPPPPEAEAIESRPAPPPDVTEISPVKRGEAIPTHEATREEYEEHADAEKVYVRKTDHLAHRGAEARFGRMLFADYFSYSSDEFSGHFRISDERTISIIDARDTKYGRFLLYDSKTGILRRLKMFSKYIYTIGPSVHEDEPIVGSVTFLAKNDRIDKFILLLDGERIAKFPNKIHIREKGIRFTRGKAALEGFQTLPPEGAGHPGGVILSGPECVPERLVQGFTRALGKNGSASLAFAPRGCGENASRSSARLDVLAGDASAALDMLARDPGVDTKRLGFIAMNHGVAPALLALQSPHETRAAFLVCVLDDFAPVEDMPGPRVLNSLDIPSLWIIGGRDTTRWNALVAALEAARDKVHKPISIVIAPLRKRKDLEQARGENSGWLEHVAEGHARLISSWLATLKE
ncbi:hypothetical protein [Pseudodesulfovibrio tunisiensis]|uniref:hypothetical protein n=1 Tax=Pseudodesulfovibrio tunisiensis TaxID=463192 RepID=UPI001FB295FF|nr:hypothetical protein [Pseudodesulfovibrio tunisiensis]